MTTTSSGRQAEELVAQHLQADGHTIVGMNWRIRWCEIDIVSTTKDCVFFTEVKYRSSSAWGDGFDYITPKKLNQMHFAAEFWLTQNKWTKESQLLAAEVDAGKSINLVEL